MCTQRFGIEVMSSGINVLPSRALDMPFFANMFEAHGVVKLREPC